MKRNSFTSFDRSSEDTRLIIGAGPGTNKAESIMCGSGCIKIPGRVIADIDVDGDGDLDIFASEREEKNRLNTTGNVRTVWALMAAYQRFS